MKSVFLDSSVIVAACASETGGSSYILSQSRDKKIKVYVSSDVIREARKNIQLKIGSTGVKRFIYILEKANLNVIRESSPERIATCEEVITQKDAPILASFLESPAKYLVTLDRKDFLQPQVMAFTKPRLILTPKEFIMSVLRKV